MKKQPQITERTRARLCAAFWKLYTEKPIEKISVREITELAGCNRGTFYLYYRDVYDLFSQIENELLGKISAVLEESLRTNDTFDLSGQMSVLVELMQTHSHYAVTLLGDRGDPHFTTRLKEIIWPLINRYFVPTEGYSTQQAAILSEFYLSGLLAAVTCWLKAPGMPIDEFITFIVSGIFGSREN